MNNFITVRFIFPESLSQSRYTHFKYVALKKRLHKLNLRSFLSDRNSQISSQIWNACFSLHKSILLFSGRKNVAGSQSGCCSDLSVSSPLHSG